MLSKALGDVLPIGPPNVMVRVAIGRFEVQHVDGDHRSPKASDFVQPLGEPGSKPGN